MTTLKEAFVLINFDYLNDKNYNTLWINNKCYSAKTIREKFNFNIKIKSIRAKFLCYEYEGMEIITE